MFGHSLEYYSNKVVAIITGTRIICIDHAARKHPAPLASPPRFRHAQQELTNRLPSQRDRLKRMMSAPTAVRLPSRSSQRHGPYFEWTYKVKGKTINVKLSAQAAPSIQAATNRTVAQGRSGQDGTLVPSALARLASKLRYRLIGAIQTVFPRFASSVAYPFCYLPLVHTAGPKQIR